MCPVPVKTTAKGYQSQRARTWAWRWEERNLGHNHHNTKAGADDGDDIYDGSADDDSVCNSDDAFGY